MSVGEQNVEALATHFLPQGLDEVELPYARRSTDEDVAMLAYVVARRQRQDVLAIDGGVELEVEGLQVC